MNNAYNWYVQLKKPSWAPPRWLFGPVWAVLYIIIAITFGTVFYFKAFAKVGLSVIRLEEWVSHKVSDQGPRKPAEDLARKETPLFMCLELKKI